MQFFIAELKIKLLLYISGIRYRAETLSYIIRRLYARNTKIVRAEREAATA